MNKYLFNLHDKWNDMVHKIKLSQMKNTSSGTDKVSLSHHVIFLSLENEKATLLICIGLFLHLFS